MEPRQIHPVDVPYVWHEVKPLVDKVLDRADGEMISSDYIEPLLSGECTLWIGLDDDEIKSALICEVMVYPRKKALHIHVWATKSGQDFAPWMEYWDDIEDFGRSNGCTMIEAKARKGLAKKLNWNDKYSFVTKHI